MEPTRVVRTVTWLAAAVLGIGLCMALAYSAFEALRNPGYSLADGYWLGALPWMGIIEALVVGGATACVVAGAASVTIGGGWARRAIVVGAAAVAGLWWFMAVAGAGISRAACAGCPPPAVDPWAYAYSSPQMTLALLIVPALVVGLVAVGGRRPIP
jgi:hypothetical protein